MYVEKELQKRYDSEHRDCDSGRKKVVNRGERGCGRGKRQVRGCRERVRVCVAVSETGRVDGQDAGKFKGTRPDPGSVSIRIVWGRRRRGHNIVEMKR